MWKWLPFGLHVSHWILCYISSKSISPKHLLKATQHKLVIDHHLIEAGGQLCIHQFQLESFFWAKKSFQLNSFENNTREKESRAKSLETISFDFGTRIHRH